MDMPLFNKAWRFGDAFRNILEEIICVTEMHGSIELSIVMPCLNEAETLAACISKAHSALRNAGVQGEIVVADNGSTDGSAELAERFGARVARVEAKGYGNALMGGVAAAKGKYILMGDADDSYDFSEAARFLAKLREGYDLVQGCRLPAGGGVVLKGAMPFSHRWLGNPVFSLMAKRMFASPIHDINCGMRAFSKAIGIARTRKTANRVATWDV